MCPVESVETFIFVIVLPQISVPVANVVPELTRLDPVMPASTICPIAAPDDMTINPHQPSAYGHVDEDIVLVMTSQSVLCEICLYPALSSPDILFLLYGGQYLVLINLTALK